MRKQRELRPADGGQRAGPGCESVRPRVNSSSIIVSHILITFCASHLVITCAPSLGVVSVPAYPDPDVSGDLPEK